MNPTYSALPALRKGEAFQGRRLRYLREKAQLSRKRLRYLVGLYFEIAVSEESIRLHELGRRPQVDLLRAYRRLFGVDRDVLP